MEPQTFLDELAKECTARGITPKELLDSIIKTTEPFHISKRNMLKAGVGLGVLSVAAAGVASAGPTDQGQISAQSGQFAKVEGPSDSTVIDLSSDIVDLQNTNRMVLPLYAGTNPSTVVGDFYYDTTSD